jgi:hypothetical protein
MLGQLEMLAQLALMEPQDRLALLELVAQLEQEQTKSSGRMIRMSPQATQLPQIKTQ